MGMHILDNNALRICVSDSGAELCSVMDKSSGAERIWTADPAIWNRHAPILFPFVGRVTGGKYRIGEQEYLMKTQHMLACSSTIINNDLWESLSAEDQAIFQEVFTWLGNRIDELTVQNEDALFAQCEANGMTIIDDIDTDPFRANAAKVVEDYPAWQDWYNQIQAIEY